METLFVLAVEAIYAAATEPDLWPQALQAIADCFSDVGTVLLWKRDDGSMGSIASPLLAAAQADYQSSWWRQDIRVERAIERGYTTKIDAITDRDVVTPDEVETHPIYQSFLIPHGLGWVAATHISPDPSVQVWISIQRNLAKTPYSMGELETVTRLGRHAEKAFNLSIRLLDAELTNIGLGAALARVGIGVFALDSLKRVVFSNPAAERLLGDGIARVNDRLLISASPERDALETAIERMIRAKPEDIARDPTPIVIHRQRADRPLAAYILPVTPRTDPGGEFLTHTRAIVLMIDPRSDEPADPALVRDVLGLTLGEARVAALVGAGLPPREAAIKLGIAEETARTVLKRVFSKIGVSRQSELTALLTKLVLRSRPLDAEKPGKSG